MNPNDELLKRINNIERRLDRIESYLTDFEPFHSSDELDIMYPEAEALVRRHEMASASLLQRRLAIGYARAARILDQLEERGVVGPAEGATPRKVLQPKES